MQPGAKAAPPESRMNRHAIWRTLYQQAAEQAHDEPLLARHLQTSVLEHDDIRTAFGCHFAAKLASRSLPSTALTELAVTCALDDPSIVEHMSCDLLAAFERDPAGHDLVNVFLNQKGFQALQAYRLAHYLWRSGRNGLALHLQGRVAEVYGLDIHPAARIAGGVFVDHGTGVVIGETAEVGHDVTIFQDVTLGGTGKQRGDRHPKIERGVLLCAGAKVLGNVRIGAHAKIGAGSIVLSDVPPGATAVGVPALIVNARRMCVELSQGAA